VKRRHQGKDSSSNWGSYWYRPGVREGAPEKWCPGESHATVWDQGSWETVVK